MNKWPPSKENPPFIVAELSGNHGGSIQKALELVDAAVSSGADAVKLQTYTAETITVAAKTERFFLSSGLWKGKYLCELYEQAMTPWDWHAEIAERARENGLVCFSSPFDETAVDFLEREMDPPIYKIASFELNHFPLLKKIGSLKKPVFASIGVSSEAEIQSAVDFLIQSGCPECYLLHCVSEYPAKLEDFNLTTIPFLEKKFSCKIGVSDHSYGFIVPVVATSLGARVIEKHLCLDRDPSSIDGQFSLLPEEFKEMANAVRDAHKSMGSISSSIDSEHAKKGNRNFKRSILVSKNVKAGEIISENNVRVARPGDGMCPSKWFEILGKRFANDLVIGDPLCKKDIS